MIKRMVEHGSFFGSSSWQPAESIKVVACLSKKRNNPFLQESWEKKVCENAFKFMFLALMS